MAGLLTNSHLEYLPELSVAKVFFKMFYKALQQRACSGFTPDSLLIAIIVEQ
jgi:hypothetical protein